MDRKLSAPERSDLRRLEGIIERGKQTFIDVGQALKAIRDERLYREKWKTFDAYCEDRFEFQRAHAYRLIEASEAVQRVKLSPIGDKIEVKNEHQARAIAEIPEEEMQEVLDEVVEHHQDTGEPVTAKSIKQAAKKVAEKKKPMPSTNSEKLEKPKPSKSEPAWKANRDQADEFRVRLNALIRDLDDVPFAPGLERLHNYRKAILRDLESAKGNIVGCVPEHVCPYCQGNDPECSACKGFGWMSKYEYKQAPKELRDETERVSNGGHR